MTRLLDLDAMADLPTTGGVAVSPDGSRLVTTVVARGPDGRSTSSLWEVATDGSRGPRRLTWSAEGEAAPAFLPDGSLVFLSGRPDPAQPGASGSGVWLLPADGGEAHCLLVVAGGVLGLAVATRARTVAVRALLHPGAKDLEQDAAWQDERSATGTSGVLLEGLPVSWWDSWFGPRAPRILLLDVPTEGPASIRWVSEPSGTDLHDLYGGMLAVTPDGSRVVSSRRRSLGRGRYDHELVVHEDGATRVLAAGHDHFMPVASPDGHRVAALRRDLGTPELPLETWTVEVHDLDGGGSVDVAPDLELWPLFPTWSPDGSALHVLADRQGELSVLTLGVADGTVTHVPSDGSCTALAAAPDGSCLYAVRSRYDDPERVVRLMLPAGRPQVVATLRPEVRMPGRVERISATTRDGAQVHSWLVVPEGASAQEPAPVVVWVHGGPSLSWNGVWSWRTNPQLLAAEGYAVLLPDVGQSTGYGRAWSLRGRAAWGEQPYTDLLDALDALAERPDLDLTRTAAMGQSFGGWMVNWIAGHTDRFGALVSISGIWALDQQHGTSDSWTWAEQEFGDFYENPDAYARSSPHLHIADVRTPMLVVHGERDLRVPKDHSLRLWTDLQRHDVPSRLLLFPDEGHSIGKPGNLRAFYDTVLAFFDEHLHGLPRRTPAGL